MVVGGGYGQGDVGRCIVMEDQGRKSSKECIAVAVDVVWSWYWTRFCQTKKLS